MLKFLVVIVNHNILRSERKKQSQFCPALNTKIISFYSAKSSSTMVSHSSALSDSVLAVTSKL